MKPLTRLKAYRAKRAYEDFTGSEPKGVATRKLDDTDQAGYRMGSVVGVAYEARRDGETAQYFHRFAKKSRPDLVARDDGRQLYISGGNYKVTDRGIEDRSMPHLFVVNPSPRAGKAKRRKGSSMARRRRRNRSGQFVKMRRNPTRSYRRRAKRRAGRRNVTVMTVNPTRRRRRRRSTALSRALPFRTNPVRRRSYRRKRHFLRGFRRNPIGRGQLGLGQITALAVPAMLTGGGAVLAEVAMGSIPFIPAAWKTGYARHGVKAVISVVGGLVIADVLRMPKLGEYFALGGMAIATHDALKDFIAANAGGLQFGEYVQPKLLPRQFGYASPAMTFGEYTEPLPDQFRNC